MKTKNKILIVLVLALLYISLMVYFKSGKIKINSKYKRGDFAIECDLVLKNDSNEIQKAKSLNRLSKPFKTLPPKNFIFDLKECQNYINIREFNRFEHITSESERNFPIAFSILTHNNIEQFERFFRSIYRSHNIYCIHVDAKSNKKFRQAIRSIVNCFDNVFISSQLERVIYAGYSRLVADLNCIKDLLYSENLILNKHKNFINKKFIKWKYLINTASSEFPLKTNYEIVQILNILNGSNSIYIDKGDYSRRYKNKYEYVGNKIFKTNKLNSQVPLGLKIIKGSAYIIASRNFLENVFKNQNVLVFLEWLKKTYSPDEFFWSTIEYNKNVFFNSSFYKDSDEIKLPSISRYVVWLPSSNCKGKNRHGICIHSIENIPNIINKRKVFLNKLILSYDPIAYQCFEFFYQNRVFNLAEKELIDKEYYLEWVKKRTIIFK